MAQLEVAVIGTGWIGGIRAETLARSALPKKLHICEIRPDRLAEMKALCNPATATTQHPIDPIQPLDPDRRFARIRLRSLLIQCVLIPSVVHATSISMVCLIIHHEDRRASSLPTS